MPICSIDAQIKNRCIRLGEKEGGGGEGAESIGVDINLNHVINAA
jgi:hypothetical protein